ncbi:MAG: DUF2262 domain-containing protein [Verrucomicrobiota bacterium]
MKTPILGDLEADEHIPNFYSAVFKYRDRDLTVCLDPDDAELDVTLGAARKGLLDLERIEQIARREASSRLLKTYNESWREYQESDGKGGWEQILNPMLEAHEFESRLTLMSVTVSGEGDISLGFHDGDLFAGHVVEVNSLDGLVFEDLNAGISG